jgi:vancomycin resistance protein YoaR
MPDVKDVKGTSSLIGRLVSSWLKLAQPRKSIIVVLVGTGLIAFIYLIYSLLFLGRVYPNIRVGAVEFGGLTPDQARTRLETTINEKLADPIRLTYQDQTFTLTSDEVGWQADLDASIASIYGVGRTQGFIINLINQLKAPFVIQARPLVATYGSEALSQKIADIVDGIGERATDANAEFINDKLVVAGEKAGQRVDGADLSAQILSQWQTLSVSEIRLVTSFAEPGIILGDETALRSSADGLGQSKLIISWLGKSRTLSGKEIRTLIGFIGRPPKPEEKTTKQILTAQFTPDQVKTFLTNLGTDINQPAQDPKLVITNGALQVAEPAKDGQVIDLDASTQAILSALTTSQSTVQLVWKTEHPLISENNLAELGITTRIGYGETSFAGSPQNRRHNIANGVAFLQSALIKPGEEFSTIKSLGPIDQTTGYLPELVIKENETTPEFGGGLCQVSTTLFRAVLNAGLKVTARQNHSYRVSYYEPPVGLDATIYFPKPDLKFLNDTPAHILVQGRVEGNKVIFELWGTSDGRSSVISAPSVSNLKDPPDPIYTETDTLAKGEVKQTDKPHQGATAVITYSVTRNGQVINNQTFKSIYKAWPARFLVGTHEDPPPPPA